jgi:hypothetical protein
MSFPKQSKITKKQTNTTVFDRGKFLIKKEKE